MMTDTIKANIYEALYEDEFDQEEVYDMVIDLEESHIKQFKEDHRGMREELEEAQKSLEKMELKLQESEKNLDTKLLQIKEEREARGYLNLLRQIQNRLFQELWKENKSILESFDYTELANKTKVLQNKSLASNDGVKFALAVIHDKCNKVSKDLSIEYIVLNNKYHPRTKPMQYIIENLTKLKLSYKKYPGSNRLENIVITESNIDETIDQINLHKAIFT